MGIRNKFKGIKFKHLKWLTPIDWLLKIFGHTLYCIADLDKLKEDQNVYGDETYYIITIEKK